MNHAYLIGNWKLFKTKAEIQSFYSALLAGGFEAQKKPGVGYAVAVSPSHLEFAVKHAPTGLEVLSQNVSFNKDGAWTGEISPLQLLDVGVVGTLVGHSERRQHFGDTDETVARRALLALECGLKVVFCVGETLGERESQQTSAVLKRQIQALFGHEGAKELLSSAIKDSRFWVAYEPVWAIGTGKTATPEMANEAHQSVKSFFEEAGVNSPFILYGGSVKPTNFKELLGMPLIAGGLVGGASLEASSYLTLMASFE